MPSSNRSSSSTSSRAASRAVANARSEIIDSIKEDHKRVKKSFRQFEKLDAQEDAEQCEALVKQTCAELTVHATLEEELLYPNARQLLKETDLIDEAEVEHASAKSLIQQLEQMSSDDEKYAATFKVLGEYVNHHIKEEEGEMLPQLEKAKADWQSLCDEFNSRREELMQQLMPQQESEEEQDGGGSSQARSRSSGAGASRGAARGSRQGSGTGAEQRAQAASSEEEDQSDDA